MKKIASRAGYVVEHRLAFAHNWSDCFFSQIYSSAVFQSEEFEIAFCIFFALPFVLFLAYSLDL